MINFLQQKFLVVLIMISVIACNSAPDKKVRDDQNNKLYSLLPDDTCGHIIKASIISAGGLEKWKQMEALSYTKIIQEYDSAGNLQNEITQYHTYQLQPNVKMRIAWSDSGKNYLVIYNGDSARKFVNSKPAATPDDYDDAWHSTWGSHYVLFQPFKLADGGAKFVFEGTQNILNKKVLAIKVLYSGQDTSEKKFPWWYYFDVETKEIAGYATPGKNNEFGLTEYAAFASTDGIKLPAKRIGYHADKDKNPIYKTTVYMNRDFKFFNNPSDSLFRFPSPKTNM